MKRKKERWLRPYNRYDGGGSIVDPLKNIGVQSLTDYNPSLGEVNLPGPGEVISGAKGGLGILSSGSGSPLGAIGGAVGQIGYGALSGGLNSGAGSAINAVGSTLGGALSTVNPLLGGIVSAASGVVGGAVKRLAGTKFNQERINEINKSNDALRNASFSSDNTDALMEDYDTNVKTNIFNKGDIGRAGTFAKGKLDKKYNELQANKQLALQTATANVANSSNNILGNQVQNTLINEVAYGGPITMRYSGPMSPFGNTFKDGGGIHIKKKNRGKFTKYCGGKVTSECIARGKRSSDPAVRKRATFAANARKWHHALGGELMSNGTEWDNGLTYVGNGGTHEENPLEGVPMGVDNEGNPNLVEQGEVIFNDYVFSNRLFADGGLLESVNLPKAYDGYSFAAIAERLGKESKERPNDPISKRGLMSSMIRLQQAQEAVRQNMTDQEENRKRKYATGGLMVPYYNAPEDTMWDPMSNSSVYTGDPLDIIYEESKPYRFGAGVTPSGEWVEEPKNMARAAAKRAGYNVGTSLEDYNENPIANPNYKGGKSNNKSNPTWLRYAPVLGSAIGLAQNIFSSPDYSSADAILEASRDAGRYMPVEDTPIGNYLTYNPFDRDYYINKLNANTAATRRSITGQSAGNRGAAMAGLLAADYNSQTKLGELARQAAEYNFANRQAVENFNRGTNMANSEMGLKAAMANQEAALKSRSSKLSGIAQAMAMRDAIDARRGASYSANLTNLFNSLGDIGREEVMKTWINENPALYYAISTGGRGVSYKGKDKDSKSKRSNGGYLTIKSKRK